jgi:hypothetical protein
MGGFPAVVGVAMGRAVGIGVVVGSGGTVAGGGVDGTRVDVSGSDGDVEGAADSTGSGLVSSGRTVAVGADFGVDAGDDFGRAVGVGVSSEGPGVFARKGVEAASCARTTAAVKSSAMAKTSERMISVSSEKFSVADASVRLSARSRAIPAGFVIIGRESFFFFAMANHWTAAVVATKTPYSMTQTRLLSSRAWR